MVRKKGARKKAKTKSKIIFEVVVLCIILLFIFFVTEFSDNPSDYDVWDNGEIISEVVVSNESTQAVSVIYLTKSDCSDCADLNEFVDALESTGIVIGEKRYIEYSSREGISITNKYDIDSIPTVILDSNAAEYQNIRSGWQVYGSIEEDAYVMRKIPPLYYSISKKTMIGYVDVTYLTDSSCEECYNPELHDVVLERIDVIYGKKKHVDISNNAGQELIEKYDIMFVPTIILSEELGEYNNAKTIFDQYFTLESDGMYVFRNFEDWNGVKYKDLSTGEIRIS